MQAPDFRIESEHLAVGDDIRTPDFDDLTSALWPPESLHKIIQHIANGDGLDTGINPTGTDHQRHALGEITDHFKGKASRSHNHTGSKFRDRHTALPEDISCLLP